MSDSVPPLLWLVIGPNGAGKSSFYDHRIAPRLRVEFINANRISAEMLGAIDPSHAYEAARIATARRRSLLASGRSMVFETVFSHPSKLAFAEEALARGYELRVSLIVLDSPDRCVDRVARRVRRGGHPVPELKIRQRFARMLPLAISAARLAGRAWIYDNSSSEFPFRQVMSLASGSVVYRADPLPDCIRGAFLA